MICRVVWYVLLIPYIKQNEPADKDDRNCEITFIHVHFINIIRLNPEGKQEHCKITFYKYTMAQCVSRLNSTIFGLY